MAMVVVLVKDYRTVCASRVEYRGKNVSEPKIGQV